MAERIDFPKEEIERLYITEGRSSTEIAELFNCHPLTVRARMRDYGIPLRPRGWQKLKRLISDEILEQWPSSELGYVIGLLASDGNLEKDNNCVIVTTTDLEIVDNVRQLVGLPNHHLTTYQPVYPHKQVYILQICDHAFRSFVEGLGLTPKKALSLTQLNIPDEIFVDFFRGEMDGDGSWSVVKGWRGVKYLRAKVTSKSGQYLDWLQSTVERLTGLTGTRSGYGLVYNGKNAERLGEWLYYAPNLLSLSRKRDIWEGWCQRK